MSRDLDEAELQREVYDLIRGYGRQAAFHIKDDGSSPYDWWITPPRATGDLRAGENAEDEIIRFLIPTLNIEFTPYRTMKIVDSKDSLTYRVTGIDPIDSGEITTAYRISAEK